MSESAKLSLEVRKQAEIAASEAEARAKVRHLLHMKPLLFVDALLH